jgi:hypothetical protein
LSTLTASLPYGFRVIVLPFTASLP